MNMCIGSLSPTFQAYVPCRGVEAGPNFLGVEEIYLCFEPLGWDILLARPSPVRSRSGV